MVHPPSPRHVTTVLSHAIDVYVRSAFDGVGNEKAVSGGFDICLKAHCCALPLLRDHSQEVLAGKAVRELTTNENHLLYTLE
jgi:hypothetical protein